MSNELISEAWLRQELRPLTEDSAPLFAIPMAPTTRSRRRRNRIVGLTAGGLVVVSLAAAGTLHLIPYGPFAADDVPICNASTVVSGAAETLKIGLDDLPSDLLLGWPTESGPMADAAYARRDVRTCALPPLLRLIDVKSGIVVRTVDISATPDGPEGALSTAGGEPSPSTKDEQPDEAWIRRGAGGLVAAWHTDEGYTYGVETLGMNRDDLQGLLNGLTVTAGTVEISGWPGRAEFEYRGSTSVDGVGTHDWWEITSGGTDGAGPRVSLLVHQNNDPAMLHATVGDHLISIAGSPALQSADGSVLWKPNSTSTAQLSGAMPTEQLLELAQQVVRLGAEDQELEELLR